MKYLLFVLLLFSQFISISQTDGEIPSQTYNQNEVGKIISPQISSNHLNMPSVFNGFAILAGNAAHEVWDISDPYTPSFVTDFTSIHNSGEAESHQISYHQDTAGNYYMVTISGRGIDIWDITETTNPVYKSATIIPGVNYGDVDRGIWGVVWQGDYIYIGATNNGLYIVDASDVNAPTIVTNVPKSNMGDVKPGPLFALGSLLVITTPKNNAGIVTLDISNPENPIVLDFYFSNNESYFGGFYGTNAYLISPGRVFDVTTDPSNIELINTFGHPSAEYFSFDEDNLFLGGLRGGTQGIYKYDISNPAEQPIIELRIPGRSFLWDDQFSCPIGNLLLICDDQKVSSNYVGGILAPHEAEVDFDGPTVKYTNPKANEQDVSPLSAVGISLSDWIEFKSVNINSFYVRKIGGEKVEGNWSCTYTTLNFAPSEPFDPLQTYEVVLPSGGITDLVGNPIEETYSFTFKTGVNNIFVGETVLGPINPSELGEPSYWSVLNPSQALQFTWETDEGEVINGTNVSAILQTPGRHNIQLKTCKIIPNETLYEAENASLFSGVSTKSDFLGFSGTGYAAFPNYNGPNVKVAWTINVSDAQTSSLNFRYTSFDFVPKILSIKVNGQIKGNITFEPTPSLTTYRIAAIPAIELESGVNVIELIANQGQGGPNIDYLMVSSVADEIHESEATTLQGGINIANNHNGYTGNGFIDYPNRKGASVYSEWQISIDTAQASDFVVRYANGSIFPRKLKLYQNGVFVKVIKFNYSGGWNKWNEIRIEDLALNQGINSFKLVANAGTKGPNIDHTRLLHNKAPMCEPYQVLTFTQVVHYPLAETKPISNQSILLMDNEVWVLNPDNHTLSVINAQSNQKLSEIPVGLEPKSLALGPDGNVWVVNRGSWSISIIDKSTKSIVEEIILPIASQPNGIVFDNDGFTYVPLKALGKVLKIDASSHLTVAVTELNLSNQITPKIKGISLDLENDLLYVNRFISPDEQGEVYKINIDDMVLNTVIPLSLDPGPDGAQSGRGIPNYLTYISITPDGKEAWITSKKDNIVRGEFLDSLPLQHDNAVRAITSVIDLNATSELLSQRIDFDNRDRCNFVQFNEFGDLAFIALQGNNEIAVINRFNGNQVTSIETKFAPDAILIDDENAILYVHNFLDRSLSVYNIADLLYAGGNASEIENIQLVENETLSQQELLGKRLFYDATLMELNMEGYMSCASCHLDGGSDGRIWDFTNFGEGFRNTIDLRGKGGTDHGPLHWTANFDEVHDFENQIRNFGLGTGLMDDNDFQNSLDPLGTPKAGYSLELDALSEYISSLNTFDPSPYRNQDGTFTALAEEGRSVFNELNCSECHSGEKFTDSPNGLRHDIGTIKPHSGNRIGSELDGFDTPTLLGLWSTAPYLHDGSAKSINEAVLAHDNVTIDDNEMTALVAFLKQLEGDQSQNKIIARRPSNDNQFKNTPILDWSIHPNPAKSLITIEHQAIDFSTFIIEVYDINGSKVDQILLNNTTRKYDISHLNSGTYLFKVIIDNEWIDVKKVTKL